MSALMSRGLDFQRLPGVAMDTYVLSGAFWALRDVWRRRQGRQDEQSAAKQLIQTENANPRWSPPSATPEPLST